MRISVITVNYNDVEGLQKTIRSIKAQDYNNIEFIVIDGGSTDGSKELLEQEQNHISYWVSEKDSGIYNAMNKGIDASSGDYLIFINSGDELYEKEAISKFVAANYRVDLVYGDVNLVYPTHAANRQLPNTLSFYFLRFDNLCHQTVFFKKDFFEKYGKYDENYKILSDWKLWTVAICKQNASYKHHPEVVANFEIGGISSNQNFGMLMLDEKAEILRNEFALFEDDYAEYHKFKEYFYLNQFQNLEEVIKYKYSRQLSKLFLRLNKLIKF